jgi:hypothetical protein
MKDGRSILFWQDTWNGRTLKLEFPELFSFAKKDNISLHDVMVSEQFQDLFHLPLSLQAFELYGQLETFVLSLQLEENLDQWSYIWGNATFSSIKVYKRLIGSQPVHPAHRWLWKSSCQPKHKIFFWLLMHDKLNTRGRLRRRNMHLDSYVCELCILQREETLRHLFL